MSKHTSHHYSSARERKAKRKGCLVMIGFIAIMFLLVFLLAYVFN